ncbi:MAG: secretin N-terminal domain-containing protein [Phycisphaerales bacterium]
MSMSSRPSVSRRLLAGLSAAWLLAGAGSALAQEKEKEAPPLQGPKVNTNRPPELEDRFIPGSGGRMREAALRMPAYMEVIGKLRADDTPAELRLTEEQQKKIEDIGAEYRRAQREGNAARPQQRPNRRPEGDRPQGEPAPEGEMMDQAMERERAEARRRNQPNVLGYQGRIWAVLSEPQQTFVKGELEKAREEMEKRRGEEYMQREMERIKKENEARSQPQSARPAPAVSPKPEGAPPAAPRPIAGVPAETRERVQRIMDKLRQMEPEERDRLLRRIEEELDRRDARPEAAAGDARRTEVVTLQHTDATQIVALVRAELPRSARGVTIQADPRTNSVVIAAEAGALPRVVQMVRRLDRVKSEGEDAQATPAPKKPRNNKPGKAGVRPIRPGGESLPPPSMDGVEVPKPDRK